MKIKAFIWSLILSLVTGNVLSVSHSSVHFFHAEETHELVENAFSHNADSLDTKTSSHSHVHSILNLGDWFCDFFDEITHSSIIVFLFTMAVLWIALTVAVVPLWVAVYSAAFYPSFWGRAPPSSSSI